MLRCFFLVFSDYLIQQTALMELTFYKHLSAKTFLKTVFVINKMQLHLWNYTHGMHIFVYIYIEPR